MVKYIRFTKEEDEYLRKRTTVSDRDAVNCFCMKFGNLHSRTSIYRRFNKIRLENWTNR